jgi:hypothetical protein
MRESEEFFFKKTRPDGFHQGFSFPRGKGENYVKRIKTNQKNKAHNRLRLAYSRCCCASVH